MRELKMVFGVIAVLVITASALGACEGKIKKTMECAKLGTIC